MEQFKKNILNLFKPHYIAIVVLAVITAFLAGIGYYFSHFYSIDQTFSAFTTNGYATLDVKCVSGPFAEETDNEMLPPFIMLLTELTISLTLSRLMPRKHFRFMVKTF